MRTQRRNLSKYDAPLSIQFGWGYKAFKKGNLDSKLKQNSMQHREWQRGFNSAYYMQLERTKNVEARRRGEKIHER